MKTIKRWLVFSLIAGLVAGNLFGQDQKEIHKTFKTKRRIRIRTVSGDCFVKKGPSTEIIVDLVYKVYPEDAFEPEIDERQTTLEIRERWYNSSSGRVTWTLTVPEETEIDFSTASGELTIEGLNSIFDANTASGDVEVLDCVGEFDFSTASGDILIENSKGEFDLSTASGEVEADNIAGEIGASTASGEINITSSTGVFDLSCASGDIDASGLLIEGHCSFSTASGRVYVTLSETPEYNLELSSASGRVTLDYDGNPVRGFFEFTAREDGGDIRSPFGFDDEETYYRHDYRYMRKSFTKGSASPRIMLSTATGSVTLKK